MGALRYIIVIINNRKILLYYKDFIYLVVWSFVVLWFDRLLFPVLIIPSACKVLYSWLSCTQYSAFIYTCLCTVGH